MVEALMPVFRLSLTNRTSETRKVKNVAKIALEHTYLTKVNSLGVYVAFG